MRESARNSVCFVVGFGRTGSLSSEEASSGFMQIIHRGDNGVEEEDDDDDEDNSISLDQFLKECDKSPKSRVIIPLIMRVEPMLD